MRISLGPTALEQPPLAGAPWVDAAYREWAGNRDDVNRLDLLHNAIAESFEPSS